MSDWPIGLSTGCIYQTSIFDCLEPIRNGGFSMIEICSFPAHLDYHDKEAVRRAATQIDELGMEPYSFHAPFADHIEDFRKRDAERVNWLSTRIDCVEYFDARDRALLSHATQIDPEGGFFSASRVAARKYWPTEEFELAVDRTDRPPLTPGVDFQESDLFAGVRRDDGSTVPAEGMLPASPSVDEYQGESA